MAWRKLLKENKIQEKSISETEVRIVFVKAQRTLRSAKYLLDEDEESAYQLAYEAMLIAGRALMFFCGVKPRSAGAHKITIEFCEAFLGKSYHLFIEKLDRARKKRHYLIYGMGAVISPTETRNLLNTARGFLSIIKEKIGL